MRSAEQFIERHGDLLPPACAAYESVDQIADDSSVQLVLVATPPDARIEIVRTLAAAGKHLLVEKPLERNLPAATAVVEAAEAASEKFGSEKFGSQKLGGVKVGVFLQHRHKPSVLRLHELASGGALGALAMVEASVPWWRPQRYYDQPGRGTYARDGGGVLLTQAIHTLDVMLSLTGPVSAVTALTATTRLHQMESEDFASVGIEFANGAVGNLLATTAAFPGSGEYLVFHHDEASARLEGDTLTVSWGDGRVETFGEPAETGSGENPMAFSSDWHAAVIADMVSAMKDDRQPLVSARDALGVHAFIDAIERSGAAHERVKLR